MAFKSNYQSVKLQSCQLWLCPTKLFGNHLKTAVFWMTAVWFLWNYIKNMSNMISDKAYRESDTLSGREGLSHGLLNRFPLRVFYFFAPKQLDVSSVKGWDGGDGTRTAVGDSLPMSSGCPFTTHGQKAPTRPRNQRTSEAGVLPPEDPQTSSIRI